MSFLNRPVNLWLQMMLVFIGTIVGPSSKIILSMDFARVTLDASLFTLTVLPFIFLGISIIPFGLIKKLEYGALAFVYLYIATMVVFYVVGMYSSGIAQNAGLDQHSAANLGVLATIGVYAIIGMVIMYYVSKWSSEWNRKFIVN